MAKYGSSDLKFYESGFLILGTKIILGLDNVSLSYKVNTESLKTFDLNRVVSKYPTDTEWTASAKGTVLSLTSDTYSPMSGDTRVTGATNGYLLLEQAKAKTELSVVFKIDSANYQTSTCILTSYQLDADAGNAMTYSIELTGTADLTKSAT